MKYGIVTVFPELFDVLEVGLLGKAQRSGEIAIEVKNPREFATDKHRSVDDSPYGGGSGMVFMPGPIVSSIEALDPDRRARRVLMSPQGAPLTQATARRLAGQDALVLVCGRYEGFDDRIRDEVDEEISLGDFVLLGGEVAALALIEATARLLPGVIGNPDSFEDESHADGLLEYPQYTRPPEFRGKEVPAVLKSGNHKAIDDWRRQQSLVKTRARRPDLFARYEMDKRERKLLAAYDAEHEGQAD